ncbi:MAG: hypothetical protein FJW30_24545 [Acidobacteria bacterium]|nr:hypothetical protein [Acidobacteriota bacterium]
MTLPLDHKTAVSNYRLERYLLGELDTEERDAFEEHYFSCPVCAQDVVVAAKFLENAKRPLLRLAAESPAPAPSAGTRTEKKPDAPPQGERWWDRWLALTPKPALAMACMGLLAAVGLQYAAGGDRPEVTGSYFVTSTRDAGNVAKQIRVQKGQNKIALLLNRTNPSVARYAFVLEGPNGVLRTFESDAPGDTNEVMVLLPVRGLAAGRYTLRVKDAVNDSETSALPFELIYP